MKITQAFYVVGLFVAVADAIKCYQCYNCAKPENSMNCSKENHACALEVVKGKIERGCTHSVAECLKDVPKSEQCSADIKDNCVTCCDDKDNCNSTGIASFDVFTVVTVMLLSFFVMKQ